MALAVTLLFACESNFDQIQKINISEMMPTGDADSIHLKYSDSGVVKSILKAPKMLDFGAVNYPFTEFPKGIHLTLLDEKNQASFVEAQYSITHKETGIIDLRNNVRLTSPQGQVLETSQLYYDQKNEWFFTEKNFTFTDAKGITKGEGIDFNKDFTRITYKNVYAETEVE
ncbi:MAG: LPS export ABC transporter periplasmic protein LptC [Flavobacterium sp.]